MKRFFLVLAFAWFAAGCAGPSVDRYGAEQPLLDLPGYFAGRVEGWGMFQDRRGEVLRRFKVVVDGHWEAGGARGVLDEHFEWSDGTRSRRVWTLERQADGTWVGLADDVVGMATGRVSGNALHWRYVLALPVDGRVYHVDFDDWMFLVDDKVMLNRSAMSKWGVHLGDVTLSFTRR